MKRFITVLVFAAVTLTAFAQEEKQNENEEIRTIFSKHKKNGGYGAFTIGFGAMEGKNTFISGFRGMYVFDHSLGIGFGGYGFVNNHDHFHFLNDQPDINTLAGGYGGLIVEPVIASGMPLHLSFPLLLGIGGVTNNANGDWWNEVHFSDEMYDDFLVFEPSVELEFNLTRILRAAIVVSYRFTSEVQLKDTDKNVLEGLNAGLTFKFGKF